MARIHPDKEINAAIEYALEHGWTFTRASGHAFGILWCPLRHRDGCQKSVWSTPRNSFNHAREIRAAVNRCLHGE